MCLIENKWLQQKCYAIVLVSAVQLEDEKFPC